MNFAKRLTPLLAAMVLAACASAPQFQQPHVEVPSSFKEDAGQWKTAQPNEAAARGQWWLAFQDPALNALIDQASQANQGLAGAAARVKQARALAGIAEADRSPQLGAQLGVQRNGAGAIKPATGWQAGLGASYEVDLFGRVAANTGAAQFDAEGAQASYKSVLLALQADVAQTYFRLRETDAELATLNQTVRLREQSVQVNQRRFDHGDIGEFDLTRAKTELATARAEAIGLQRQRVQAEHALAVLLGKPAAMYSAASSPLDGATLPAVPAGLPSSLLERRPDIAQAQRAMMAANARIGVAKAAMFPALALTGAGGGSSDGLADVFKWSARTWSVGALLAMPLIDGGRNKANVARSEALYEEAVASYRQNVLGAFAEVEDNLAGLRILGGQAEQVDAALASARRAADLAEKLYAAGRSSYLDLLDAQRNLASAERSAVQLRGNRAQATVALIRSFGGSWSVQ